MPAGAAAAVGAIVGVAGAVEQRKQAKKAEKRAKEADQLQLATQRLQAAKARRKQLAQMREAQAANQAMAESSGGGEGSAVAGALSGLSSEAGANIGFSKQLQAADVSRFGIMQDINKATSKAATAGQVSNIGFSVAKAGMTEAGGFAGMKQDLKDMVS